MKNNFAKHKAHPTWGGRFQKALDIRVEKFHASIHFDHRLLPYDVLGSIAHANMLAEQGLISTEEALLIQDGLEKIQQDYKAGKLILNTKLEDIHMNVESLLEQYIGETAKKLHTGRSRNDQVALDIRLFLRDAIDGLLHDLCALSDALKKIIQAHQATIMPGYTHLQRAQPITLAQHLGAYAAMLERDKNRFQECRARMNYSPLGAGALAGSQLPLDRNFVASQLNFAGIIENTLDAVSSRDFAIEFCSASSILMMHLSRLCEDLILWATEEFAFITLDDAFATGSSLMPNKKNPDVPELIRGKSGRIFGHLMALLTVMKGLPLAYNKDMQEDKEALFDTVDTLKACLVTLEPFLKSLHFNENKMKQAVDSSMMDATAWVEKLVLQGIPFRQAHEIIGQAVLVALKEEKDLASVIKPDER